MVKKSLKKLLHSFPHFFDKTPRSNFHKVQEVFNKQFQKLDQAVFETYESFKLDKRCFIWKEQNEPYVYTMHFVANFPNLKSVKIYKNDELIYSEDFNYEDNINSVDYSYECDTRLGIHNNSNEEFEDTVMIFEPDIIPQDKFLLLVETYDEHIIKKGFPENDTPQGDEFDHDVSLDEHGVLNNIPRKKYIETNDYRNTEPPFNDRLTEDDYHYMKRQLHYLKLIQEVPLPVAEIFKLYGIEATMRNRERLLLKMFDPKAYPHFYDERKNENGEYISDGDRLYVDNWIPERNEHKDGFAKGCKEEDLLFLVSQNTVNPQKFSKLKFYFYFLNSFAEPVELDDFTIEIYINDVLKGSIDSLFYVIDTEFLNEVDVNLCKFIAKDIRGSIIGEQELEIYVNGCNDGDFYVTNQGNDSNDGSKENPFATLGKAISQLSSSKNLIVIGGDVVLDGLHTVDIPCTLMGCNNGTLISYREDNRFLNVAKNNEVTLIDLNLSHNSAISYFKYENYINDNDSFNNLETVIIHGGLPILTITSNQEDYYHLYDNILLNCNLKSLKGNPLKNSELKFYIDNVLYSTVITDNNGNVNLTVHFENDSPLEHTFKFKFNETDVFWENEHEKIVNFRKNTPRINRLYGRLLTLNTTYAESADLYENGNMRHRSNIDGNIISNTYLPDYGEHIVYFSENGTHVIEEWIIDARFYINDLNVESLVTDVEIDNNGKLFVTKTNLEDFQNLQDLENVIIDLSLENDVLYKARFVASNRSGLNKNELYPEDLVNMKQAIVDVTMSEDGKLEFEKISTIIIEEEE